MSRNSRSSRHQSKSDGASEDMVEQVKSIITLLDQVVSSRPNDCVTYIPSARSAVTALEQLRFFRDPQRFAEQVWILQGLQDFAFYDADNGCVQDVADFCQNSWLRVLRNYPENVDVLKGLGKNWLQRSQAILARIHREEGAESGSAPQSSRDFDTPFDYDSDDSSLGSPNDPHRQGPLYVEARGYLQPAVDFFTRAVCAADSLGSTCGDLLSSAAESHMSLGNVSASPTDERCFTQAIRYLRRAAAIPGYQLSIYLEQYLNDYGRYVV
ncbi:proliferating cell nuclear antigen (pcna) protein [Rutstroemia sp. NJR-2017a WRK4]|nr:proliferating cell nuclear antigen (pcna) protein [Rutstroemia sp. NJR-2017a WRK4]